MLSFVSLDWTGATVWPKLALPFEAPWRSMHANLSRA